MTHALRIYELGGSIDGPPLLLLHANGFHARVFEPMIPALGAFRCIALDLPGHGDASESGPQSAVIDSAVQLLFDVVVRAGLRGRCLCLGHSLGGALALSAEAAHPGLFAAIFAFEPVAAPAPEAVGSPARQSAWEVLAGMARKRRSGFASPQEALDRLGSKLPFSSLHPDALRAYLRHGLRRATAADGGGSSSSGGGEQLWQLKCAPETEAAWFTAVGECIPIRTERVRCPVMVAVGAVGSSGASSSGASSSGSGQPSRSSTTSSSTGSGGDAQPQPQGADGSGGGGGGGNIHGQLPLLGERLAEALPASLVRRYPRLSHFGPLQDPEGVASDAREFFLGVLQAQADGGSGSALRARGRAGGRAPLPASRL